MRKLSIPYTNDNRVLDLLTFEELKYVSEIFMPLPYEIIPSGRPIESNMVGTYSSMYKDEIKRAKDMGLSVSIIINKLILDDNNGVSIMVKSAREIEMLRKEYGIDKVVLSNYPFINQYGEYFRSLGLKVELSVIADIDVVEKAEQILGLHPSINSICLHNTFIFNLDGLKYLKSKYPDVEFKLLCNHGCMVNCASHVQHHNALCCVRQEIDMNDPVKWRIASNQKTLHNPTKICAALANKQHINPLNTTSFIRPEDMHYYDDYITLFKLSGREHPAEEIINWIKAFGERKKEGSLFDIIDRPFRMIDIDNDKIPEDFAQHRLNCNHNCYKCHYCDRILDSVKMTVN